MLKRNRVALALVITALVTVATLAFAGAWPTPSGTGIGAVLNGSPQAVAINGNSGNVLTSHGTSSLPTFDPVPPTFTPNGDLDGSASTQTVVGLRTVPICTSAPATGQAEIYNGTAWCPSTNFGAQNIQTTGNVIADAGQFYSVSTSRIDFDAAGQTRSEWADFNTYAQDAGSAMFFMSSAFKFGATGTTPTDNYKLTASTTDGTTWVPMTAGNTPGRLYTPNTYQTWGGTIFFGDFSGDAGLSAMGNFGWCNVKFEATVKYNGSIELTEQQGSNGGAPDGGDLVLACVASAGDTGCTSSTANTNCSKGTGLTPGGIQVHVASGAVQVQVKGIASTTLAWVYKPVVQEIAHP